MDPTILETFDRSLGRCNSKPGFLDRFYELFQNHSEEIAEKFRDTDFQRQKSALRSSLFVMVVAVEGGEAAVAYLDQVARQHSRKDLDIGPELYDVWLDCLIQSVREYDPDFTDETEELWRDVMRFGIKYMTDRY